MLHLVWLWISNKNFSIGASMSPSYFGGLKYIERYEPDFPKQ